MFGMFKKLFGNNSSGATHADTRDVAMPKVNRAEEKAKHEEVLRYDLMGDGLKLLNKLTDRLKGQTYMLAVHNGIGSTTATKRQVLQSMSINGERLHMLSINNGDEMYRIQVQKGFLGMGSKIIVTPRKFGDTPSPAKEFQKKDWYKLAEAIEDAVLKGNLDHFREIMTINVPNRAAAPSARLRPQAA